MQWDNLNLDVKGFWYIFAGAVLTLGYMLFMPKKLRWREIYLTFGVVSTLAFVSHTIVGVWFDAFDLGKKGGYGVADIFVMVIISPIMAIIFLNYFKPDKKWIYAIIFSIVSFFYEWGAVQAGFMRLKWWHTWWSIPVYLFIFGIFLPWHLRYLRTE
ncbi:hypothetical protein [Ammoniphilus sp. YIM 78166]|uniref:hypothetical protein n=1 Tax=Ammoniphilus sp. YIM 78166 TaxID=1644106 RepID=UPI0010705C2C|nr:hypothetical protein [Ammoniphilus sp. YIM 78166]